MMLSESNWIKTTLYIVSGIILFIGSILVVLYYFQSFFFYHPSSPSDSREAVRTPDTAGFSFHETITLTSSDGTNLMAYWMPYQNQHYNDAHKRIKGIEKKDKDKDDHYHHKSQKDKIVTDSNDNTKVTFLFFQGSSGNIGHRLPKMARLSRYIACNILMLSYRGYGRSDGVPDEDGISKDAMAAMEYLQSKKGVDRESIAIWGESFGSSVALDLASRNTRPMAVIIENPYLSMKSNVIVRLPWILRWMSKFTKEKWDNETKMLALVDAASTTGFMPNIMIMTGVQDKTVPPSHGYELAKIAEKGKNCTEDPRQVKIELVTFNRGGHLDLADQPGFYETIKKFLKANSKEED